MSASCAVDVDAVELIHLYTKHKLPSFNQNEFLAKSSI